MSSSFKQPPADLEQLGIELGMSKREIKQARADAKDEAELWGKWAKKWRRYCVEHPRFMDKNPARPPTYDRYRSVVDGEIINAEDSFVGRRNKERHKEEQLADVGELLGAMRELRATIEAMPRQKKRHMARTLWLLRTRLDAAERDLRRRIAA